MIVLRFRDIELSSGATIREHKLVINEYRFCWWGWLARDFERNPYSELAGVLAAAAKPFDVALYDTGRGLVYRASCTDIAAEPFPSSSPSLLHTPAYYRSRNAPAWFQFTEIEEIDEDFIVGRRCALMPSASDECFVDLAGKTVGQLRDLRRQEVTMWMLD
jgi:hypothetical protein